MITLYICLSVSVDEMIAEVDIDGDGRIDYDGKFANNIKINPTYLTIPSTISSILLLGVKKNFLNPFPNNPWYIRVCSSSLLKTPWEKEKLLAMSNFSFSHGVFYPFGELPVILSNLKLLSSVISFSLEESKICRLGKG